MTSNQGEREKNTRNDIYISDNLVSSFQSYTMSRQRLSCPPIIMFYGISIKTKIVSRQTVLFYLCFVGHFRNIFPMNSSITVHTI